MATISKSRKEKNERNIRIKNMYNNLMSDPESQKFAVYEMIGMSEGLSPAQVGKIVGNIKTKTEKMINDYIKKS